MSRQSNAKPAETGQMVLISATRRLHQAGVKAAGGDARRLLAHALKITPDRLTLVTNETVTSATAARFEVYLQRRILREPVSHILGYREFCSRKFVVTRDVLDPRPETELLVKTALENAVTSILDLGTGSGCVLLSILADMPKARGTGTDISANALTIARKNAKRLELDQRAEFQTSDWFDGVSGRFELIVSNPPYIAAHEMPDLAPEVANWEPEIALTPGGDGLAAYRAIVAGVLPHLAPHGRLMVEIGPTQANAVTVLFERAGLIDLDVRKDIDGRDRVVIGVNGRNNTA